MRKQFIVVFCLISVVAILVTGCAAGAAPAKTAPLPSTLDFTMANPKPTALTKAVTSLITKYSSMAATPRAVRSDAATQTKITQASSEKISFSGCVPCHRVATWQVAVGQADVAIFSHTGTLGIAPGDRARLRALFSDFSPDSSTLFGIQTTAKTGIKSVADLKGRSIYGDYPSVTCLGPVMQAILKANSLTGNDIAVKTFPNVDTAYKDVAEGKVDAVFYQNGDSPADLAKAAGLVIVPLSPETQKAVTAAGTGFYAATWPKGDSGSLVDAPTVASPYVAWASDRMDDNTAYTIVKTVFEHLDELYAAEPLTKGITKQTALIQWDFPYHPGAVKYFKEAGLWTSDMDARQAALLKK